MKIRLELNYSKNDLKNTSEDSVRQNMFLDNHTSIRVLQNIHSTSIRVQI